jgi:hypothetical protein
MTPEEMDRYDYRIAGAIGRLSALYPQILWTTLLKHWHARPIRGLARGHLSGCPKFAQLRQALPIEENTA